MTSRRLLPLFAVALAPLLVAPSAARAQGFAEDLTRGVAFDQRLDVALPADLSFRDATGAPVTLGEVLAPERPAILALVYYECPMLCGLVTEGLLRALRAMSLEVGEDLDVIVVSIDHGEGSALAAQAKQTLVSRYGRPGAARGFRFLTGDREPIDALCEAVGFRYRFDEETGEYAHAAGVVVLTPDGRTSRYLFGVDFPPRDLRLSLVEAGDGEIGSLVDHVMLLCFSWDPTKGRYGLVIMRALRVGGAATVIGLIVLIAMLSRGRRQDAPPGPPAAEA